MFNLLHAAFVIGSVDVCMFLVCKITLKSLKNRWLIFEILADNCLDSETLMDLILPLLNNFGGFEPWIRSVFSYYYLYYYCVHCISIITVYRP